MYCIRHAQIPKYEINNTLFTRSKNNLDCDLDHNLDRDPDVPDYTRHLLFNTTKPITLLFIIQTLLHRNPPNIWIKIIQITIQIVCLHGTIFIDLDRDLDNFAKCKQGLRQTIQDSVDIQTTRHVFMSTKQFNAPVSWQPCQTLHGRLTEMTQVGYADRPSLDLGSAACAWQGSLLVPWAVWVALKVVVVTRVAVAL